MQNTNSNSSKAAARKAAAAAKQTAALLNAFTAAQTKQRKTSNVQIACNLLANNATAQIIVNTFAAIYKHKTNNVAFIAKRAAIYMQIAIRKAAAKSSSSN